MQCTTSDKTFIDQEQPVIVIRSRSPSPVNRPCSRYWLFQPLSLLSSAQLSSNVRQGADLNSACNDMIINRTTSTTNLAPQSQKESSADACNSSSIEISDVRSNGVEEFDWLDDEVLVGKLQTCDTVRNPSRDANKLSGECRQQPAVVFPDCAPIERLHSVVASSFRLRQGPFSTSPNDSAPRRTDNEVSEESNTVETGNRTESTGEEKRNHFDVYQETFACRRDMELQCTEKAPYRCNVCGKGFSFRSSLVRHARIIHEGEKRFHCNECGKDFGHKISLLEHECTHTGEKPYHCSVCEKKFRTQSRLSEHVQIHTAIRPYSCNVCGKDFKTKSNLLGHVRTHTPTKSLSCNVCEKMFRKKSHLLDHVRIHTGEQPYQCTVCSKRFRQRSNLTQHVLVHTGYKPHRCHVCGKGFRHSSRLVRHSKTHSKLKRSHELSPHLASNFHGNMLSNDYD